MDAERDPVKKSELALAVQTISGQLDEIEAQLEDQKMIVQQTSAGVIDARAAFDREQRELDAALRKQHSMMAKNKQAAALEGLNATMAALNSPVGDGITPTIGMVDQKINERFALARANQQLNQNPGADAMAAIESAASSGSADARIAAIRARANQLVAPVAPLAIEAPASSQPVPAQPEAPKVAKPFDPSVLKR